MNFLLGLLLAAVEGALDEDLMPAHEQRAIARAAVCEHERHPIDALQWRERGGYGPESRSWDRRKRRLPNRLPPTPADTIG